MLTLMRRRPDTSWQRIRDDRRGFSLPELLIATTILLIVSGTVTSGIMQVVNSFRTISNRTALHAGVRSATEVLQQEVGQAGRVTLPGTATLAGDVAVGAATVGVNMVIASSTCSSNGSSVPCVSGIFAGEWLVIDSGAKRESVQVTLVDTGAKQITATFTLDHSAGASISATGGFASGIVPPQYWNGTAWVAYPNGSDGSHLKLFGDVTGDGRMVYVEYTCDTTNANASLRNLYRNVMLFDAGAKPVLTDSQVLLRNVAPNPGGTACFTYMPSPLPYITAMTDAGCACTQSFVLDVAITLTVNTQLIDPITRKVQTETKALLNVSPRNVFQVWQLAATNLSQNNDRIQPMPNTVKLLLP
jgi:prepilin-type N-terminal cleavage/methylation domain-containing protein